MILYYNSTYIIIIMPRRRSEWKKVDDVGTRRAYQDVWDTLQKKDDNQMRTTNALNYYYTFVVYHNESIGITGADPRTLRDDAAAARAAWTRMKACGWSQQSCRRVLAKLCMVLRTMGKHSLLLAINPRPKGIRSSHQRPPTPRVYMHSCLPDRVRRLLSTSATYQLFQCMFFLYHRNAPAPKVATVRGILLTVDTIQTRMDGLIPMQATVDLTLQKMRETPFTDWLCAYKEKKNSPSRQVLNRYIQHLRQLYMVILEQPDPMKNHDVLELVQRMRAATVARTKNVVSKNEVDDEAIGTPCETSKTDNERGQDECTIALEFSQTSPNQQQHMNEDDSQKDEKDNLKQCFTACVIQ